MQGCRGGVYGAGGEIGKGTGGGLDGGGLRRSISGGLGGGLVVMVVEGSVGGRGLGGRRGWG